IVNLEVASSGWVPEEKNNGENNRPPTNEGIDSIDNGLPSYISATAQPSAPPESSAPPEPSAPPLSPQHFSEDLISPEHSDQNSLINAGSPSLEPLNLNDDQGNDKTAKLFRSEVKKISIKLNLIKAAKKLLNFLREVDKAEDLYEGKKVKAALYRYEHYWLPLAAKMDPGTKASPPLDVHWVWIVHMLSPQNYEKDCVLIVEKIIPHHLMTEKALEKSRDLGRTAWEEHYPNEPWELNDQSDLENRYLNNESKISYQLEDAIHRQSAFFYQVSMGHYNSKAFLCKAVHRHSKVPAVSSSRYVTMLVHPVIYREDTTKILGHVFPHDDSVNDRSEGSKLSVSDASTRELWSKAFGTTFRREGAMFRGDPPKNYVNPVPQSAVNAATMSVFHVTITKGQRLSDFTLFHHGSGTTDHNVTEMNLSFTVSERSLQSWIVLKLSPGNKFGKILKFLGKASFWSMTNFHELFDIESEGTIDKLFSDDESPSTVELGMRVTRVRTSDWTPIGIMTGDFLPCVLDPQTLVSYYGMITNTKSDNQDIYLAEMATHRLLNESSPKTPQLMEIEVYHSKHFMFSAIHMFVDSQSSGRNLVGVAHTLDLNTIPSPVSLKYNIGSHLESKIATLNVSAGERAMLIKTKGKDWALLVGRWQGLRKGVKGSFSARGVPGSPGYLVVKIYKPIDASPVTITLPYEKQIYAFQLPDLFIDIENGKLQINSECEEFVEQIALGLTITVLHVLCQPRAVIDDTVDGTMSSTPPLSPLISEDTPKRIPTERLRFLAALGFFCASAPTNSFITKNVETVRHDFGIGGAAYAMTPFWSTYEITDLDNGLGACGGCGGCGGGVFETIPPPGSVLWGSSNQGGDGGGDGGDGGGDGYGGNEGGGSDWGWGPGDSGNGPGGNILDVLTGDSGGGGSCGGCGGCGGGCGGCGG
ncbi:Glycine-rich domain-containing protein 1, partial [Armadillidium nasatum]